MEIGVIIAIVSLNSASCLVEDDKAGRCSKAGSLTYKSLNEIRE